jgi:hypothetical protein
MMEPGFELYAAPFSTVLEACSDESRLAALRVGDITESFVHFPPDVPAGDILLLSTAFERHLQKALVFDIDREETDLGLFVDRVNPGWAKAVAAMPDEAAPAIERLWRSAYFEQEHHEPEWSHIDLSSEVRRVIRVCRAATVSGTDLILVWSV